MSKKESEIKDFLENFFNYVFIRFEVIYGNAFRVWWNKQGKKSFYRWAKKEGLEFADVELFGGE